MNYRAARRWLGGGGGAGFTVEGVVGMGGPLAIGGAGGCGFGAGAEGGVVVWWFCVALAGVVRFVDLGVLVGS